MQIFIKQNMLNLAKIFAFTILSAFGILAQSNSGSITGVVSDPNGGVIASATVTITNVGTNESRTAQTDADGRYEIHF